MMGLSILGRCLGGAPHPNSLNVGLRDVFNRDFPSELLLDSRPQIGKRVNMIVLRLGDMLEVIAEKF